LVRKNEIKRTMILIVKADRPVAGARAEIRKARMAAMQ
jgi:hypothetical protein